MDAAYVFRVRFRLDPPGVRVDPNEFETVLRRPADPPGETASDRHTLLAESGWLFFRDALWRGNVNDESYLRERLTDHLGVPVSSVRFSELETDAAHLDALKDAIADEIDGTGGVNAFDAESVDDVLHKYLGSSIRVV